MQFVSKSMADLGGGGDRGATSLLGSGVFFRLSFLLNASNASNKVGGLLAEHLEN